MRRSSQLPDQGDCAVKWTLTRSVKITGIYLLFGLLWITVSDQLLAIMVQASEEISRISMYKGWLFIFLTALLFFILSKHSLEKQELLMEDALLSEKRLRAVIETTNTGYLVLNEQGSVLYANQIYVDLTGHSSYHDLMGRSVVEWTASYDREKNEAWVAMCISEGRICNLCVDYTHMDGTIVPVEINAVTIETRAAKIIVALCRNISDRRRSEEERSNTIEFLRLINESRGTEELIRSTATFFKRQSGCEALGIRLKAGEDYPYFEARGFSHDFLVAENSLCPRDCDGRLLRDESGNAIVECLCGGVIHGDFDCSRPFCTEHGGFWTNSLSQFLAGTGPEGLKLYTRGKCSEKGYESLAMLPLVSSNERLGLLQLNDLRKGIFSSELIAHWERLAGYLAVALAKSLVEEALGKAEERYFNLYQGMRDGFCLIGMDGKIIEHNEAFRQMLGYDSVELEQLNLNDITPEKWRGMEKKIVERQIITRGYSDVYEKELCRKDGVSIPVEISAFHVRDEKDELSEMWNIVRDIRPRKTADEERLALETQLLQSQKMDAIGKLAGGVAHDFNNVINAIMGFCTLIQMKLNPDDPALKYLREILAVSERAASLTNSLLAFSRKQIINVKPINLNDSIRSVAKLCKNFLGEDLKLVIDLEDKDIVVVADGGQLDQIMMNLATNARDAMPDGGVLTISARLAWIDKEFIRKHGFGVEGNYALISVDDTGCGIEDDIRDKIFEPFFTTKDVGKGTGLGLSIVYGIVQQHNGFLDVISRPHEGSSFRIYLPAVDMKVEKVDLMDYVPVNGGKEVILLVEDEKILRTVTRKILEALGYSVIEAEDGIDAVEKFREHKDEIDLTLMDVIMPGKNGREAYQEIAKIRNDTKVIFVSGYTSDHISGKIRHEGLELLLKPYSPRELLNKIRGALDRG
jgi:two-component system, cell cycle sensor histidine kinase and response regulator CckA